MAVGRENTHRRKCPHRDVPRRQNTVYRFGSVGRAGDRGEAGGGVDGVVHLARAVVVAAEDHHDEVGAPRLQRLVAQPAACWKVGEEDTPVGAGVRDERRRNFLSGGVAQIDLDGALALVEPRPEKTVAVLVEGPAPGVEAAADLVETDDYRAKLRQRHAAEWRRDEGGPFDDAHSGEDAAGHAINPTRRQSRTGVLSVVPAPRALTCTRRWTRPPTGRASHFSTVVSEFSVSPSCTGPV